MKSLICCVYGKSGDDPFLSLLPVGIGSLVATLRSAGFTAKAANFISLSPPVILKQLAAERPDLLGISVMTHNRRDSIRLAELAKELNPGCFVVLGGPHASHRYRELLASSTAVDAVVIGEGEETLRELVELLSSSPPFPLSTIRGLAFREGTEISVTPPRPPLPNLDLLPAAYTGFQGGINIDLRRQLEFLITSRGCPAACSFCNSPQFWGRNLRFRSPQSMVDEIRALADRYGLIYFAIRDDTFTADRRRVMEFCRLLLEARLFILWSCQSRVSAVDDEMLLSMRRAGCDCIQYGVESGSPVILAALGKRITPEQIVRASAATRRVGIRLSLYLMTGVPGETENELAESLLLLETVRADDGQVSPLAYYPGTLLFERGVRQGEVPADLFESSTEEALYLRRDPFVAAATARLLKKIEKCAPDGRAARREAAAARQRTGYCHGGNITTGELLAEGGDLKGAEAQYREIISEEPDNPWGWLLLGELLLESGKSGEALHPFRRLAELLPAHLPAWEALAELHRTTGNRAELRRCRERVRELTELNRY